MTQKKQASRLGRNFEDANALARELQSMFQAKDINEESLDSFNIGCRIFRREVTSGTVIDSGTAIKLVSDFQVKVNKDAILLVYQNLLLQPAQPSAAGTYNFYWYMDNVAQIGVQLQVQTNTSSPPALFAANVVPWPVRAGTHAVQWRGVRASGISSVTVAATSSMINVIAFGISRADFGILGVRVV